MENKTLASVSDIQEFIILLNGTREWSVLHDKTQVFNDRVDDVIKTRGSHSDDVGEIAAQLAGGLTTDQLTIEKARLLGRLHDVGHIPFGHAGESIADKIIKDRFEHFSDEEKKAISSIRESMFGKKYADKNTKPVFEHNENSVLQYFIICKKLGYDIDSEIVEGILAHSTSRYLDLPMTLSQQAVRLADKIAYINYDTQDLQRSFEGSPEWEALKSIYQRPILDGDGNEVVIEYEGKKFRNVLEFLESIEVQDRITLFINEAIKMANADKIQHDSKYDNYQTILTGGNDIIVQLSQLKKNKEYYIKGQKKYTEKGLEEKRRLKNLLMKKNPILYLSYEMKERSDEFIRAGTGLTGKLKYEKAKNAQSAVGNEDLRNQYIYNKLVIFIENRDKIDLSKVPEKLKQEFEQLFKDYDEYKLNQESIIQSLPGNEQNFQYPEIYTILNFIGTHSNSELLNLAKNMGLNYMFNREVLPELQSLMEDKKLFDSENKKFTEEGLAERDKIIEKYGAHLKFEYGMEEYDMTPTTKEEVVSDTRQYGYSEKTYSDSKQKEISESKTLDDFHKQDKLVESVMVQTMDSYSKSQIEQQLEANGVRRGR